MSVIYVKGGKPGAKGSKGDKGEQGEKGDKGTQIKLGDKDPDDES